MSYGGPKVSWQLSFNPWQLSFYSWQLSTRDNFLSTRDNFISTRDNFLSTRDNFLSTRDNFLSTCDNFPFIHNNFLLIYDNFLSTDDNFLSIHDNLLSAMTTFHPWQNSSYMTKFFAVPQLFEFGRELITSHSHACVHKKMALLGRCLFRDKCELNCQLFVQKEEESLLTSFCLACGHLAALLSDGTNSLAALVIPWAFREENMPPI